MAITWILETTLDPGRADELRALRASPYASVPPRPMAVVPGVVLSEKK